MALWLLAVANSATAIACTVLGLALLAATRIASARTLRFVEVYGFVGIAGWLILDALFGITELIVLGLGRDMTLTTRTDAWDLFLRQDINPLIGAGFKSFWSGERMERIWIEFPGIVQAHNGYINQYLEGGIIGLLFLAAMMWAGFRSIKRDLVRGDDFARIRLMFWVIALVYNFSEAAFTQLSLLWAVTMLVVVQGAAVEAEAPQRAAVQPVGVHGRGMSMKHRAPVGRLKPIIGRTMQRS
jgi:O-antigen ligase